MVDNYLGSGSDCLCVDVVEMANKVLEGEMLSLVLRPPKGGYGQHLRVVSIVPLSTSFQPVMTVLPQLGTSGWL